MSTVKISELPLITALNANTAQTIFLAVDTVTDVTGRFTGTTLAQGLYSHNILNVGNNHVVLPNITAQFAGSSDNYLQLNLQNNSGNGSGDIVITANNGTDSTYYIDMGFNGSNYNYPGFTYAKPLDGYLVVQGDTSSGPGGNLVIGTTTANKNVSILVGTTDDSGIMAQFVHNQGFKMIGKPVIFQDNTSQNTAAAPFAYSNASFLHANSGFTHANAAILKANAAFIVANSGAAFANTVADTAAQAIINAATADSKAVTADSKAVTAGNYANSAFLRANTPHAIANSAAVYANGAFIQANAAFTKANSALANTSGTLDGSLLITNNLTTNGRLIIANSGFGTTESAVRISASNTGSVQTPGGDGYVLHMTGKHNVPVRVVSDSFGANGQLVFPLFGGRAARGNVDYPSAVQTNDVLTRIGASGFGATNYQTGGVARIDFIATENHTDSARGTAIKFYNVQEGSTTLSQIASFNANDAVFNGHLVPAKGVVYTPRVPAGNQTAITIDYNTDSVIKANLIADLTISHTNYVAGKIIEVWLVNNDNANRTVTHGCAALRSTNKSTTATITAGSSMFLKFFSIDGDNANTYVSING